MDSNCQYITYESTGYFSKIVIDYLHASPQLQPFYKHHFSIDGIQSAIKARQAFTTNRNLLYNALIQQYQGLWLSTSQEKNLELLLQENTFTITTAHQPNIFTGPLYFIYKILHAAKLAEELKRQLPENNFVPMFYMGSEDADLDELGLINLNGEQLIWNTKQTGAVGRMKVDKAFIELIEKIYGQIGVHENGKQLVELFKKCYVINTSIQQATLQLINVLFSDYGVLVVIPDNAILKKSFQSVIEKEITEQFSHKAVANTIDKLGKHYKVQAGGRDLNLFYLVSDKRERIQVSGSKFIIPSLGIEFNKDEIVEELKNHPERFSANVILRGVFQETILPNIAFIGGGGELAYWLELKNVFDVAIVPYPVLVLRNSFAIVNAKQMQQCKGLEWSLQDLFKEERTLLNELVAKQSNNQLLLEQEIIDLNLYYTKLKAVTDKVDVTLSQHVKSLQQKALQRIVALEKKLLKAEKKKFSVQEQRIRLIKKSLFPNNNLQERVENFSAWYALHGDDFLRMIYQHSKGLEQEFGVIEVH
jgi:bacillithiol biosynthesis cysteine-adding enzyme BshC